MELDMVRLVPRRRRRRRCLCKWWRREEGCAVLEITPNRKTAGLGRVDRGTWNLEVGVLWDRRGRLFSHVALVGGTEEHRLASASLAGASLDGASLALIRRVCSVSAAID